MDRQTIHDIARFKEALARPADASDSDEEFIGYGTTNRGKKLKRDARQIFQGKLSGAAFEGHGVKIIEFEGRKRAVVYKKRHPIYEGDDEAEEIDMLDDGEDEINPYEEIKLVDLLAPIGHPAEIPYHPAISKTFESTTLRTMAARALEIIVEENKHVVKFAKLMSVFLGDDPSYILSEDMNLPEFDDTDDQPGVLKNEEEETDEQSNRRITRNQISQEQDPFFALPQVNIDRDFGIPKDEAEETRQLTQIAQQRSEEFLRCMVNIRNGILKADRYKRNVYRWAKSMAGDDDLEFEIGPDIPDDKEEDKELQSEEREEETERPTESETS
jgi:hypothetical protein